MDCPGCRASVPAGKFCIECGAAFERRCDLGQVVGPRELVIAGTPLHRRLSRRRRPGRHSRRAAFGSALAGHLRLAWAGAGSIHVQGPAGSAAGRARAGREPRQGPGADPGRPGLLRRAPARQAGPAGRPPSSRSSVRGDEHRPTSRAAALKLAHALDHFGLDPDGHGRARHRRLDRRLHRRAAAARRRAGLCRRRRPRPARLAAAQRSARRRAGADQRPLPDPRSDPRAGRVWWSATRASSRSGWCCRQRLP